MQRGFVCASVCVRDRTFNNARHLKPDTADGKRTCRLHKALTSRERQTAKLLSMIKVGKKKKSFFIVPF